MRRYPNRNAFASANGTAPLPASSGRTVRHRFNPGGNRQLNRALYLVALPRSEATPKAGPTTSANAPREDHREALRCLNAGSRTWSSPPCVTT